MKRNIFFVIAFGILNISTISNSLPPCTSHEPVTNAENSALYASVIEADNTFKTTYVAQPDMFAKDKAIILTCMDPRLSLEHFMGFHSGDMYVLRNAGGLATEDSLRSLVIAHKLLAANQIFVVQHTDCGMQKFTNEVMSKLLEETIVTAKLAEPCEVTIFPVECDWKNVCKGCGKQECVDYPCTDWLPIRNNLFKSVTKTVKKIRRYSLVPSDVPIYGFIFDVITGDLIPVPNAMKAGRAKPLHCKK